MKLYKRIARTFQAWLNCHNNPDMAFNHEQALETLVNDYMPDGSGFDCGTTFDFDKSTPDKLIFKTAYHCMDEHGFYDGWIDPITIIITPSFIGDFDIKINWHGYRGRYKEIVSDYVEQSFYDALTYNVEKKE